jgi:hypothetical protein
VTDYVNAATSPDVKCPPYQIDLTAGMRSTGTHFGPVLFNQLQLQLLTVLRHEKHPKGWISVRLLGCSSKL